MNRQNKSNNDYIEPDSSSRTPINDPRYLALNECVESSSHDSYNIARLSNDLNSDIKSNETHNFTVRFFHKPVLCLHCSDYIWGSGYIGHGCSKCAECVHFKCLLFVKFKTTCRNDSSDQLEKKTWPNLYPIENWSTDLVKRWLAVVNLHRYAEVFSRYDITGSKLIVLNTEQLNEYRIRDIYHQRAILECCKELIYKSRLYSTNGQMVKEQNDFLNQLKTNPYKAESHHFLLHTISMQTNCHSCLRPLLGIVHQALICQQCGIMVSFLILIWLFDLKDCWKLSTEIFYFNSGRLKLINFV